MNVSRDKGERTYIRSCISAIEKASYVFSLIQRVSRLEGHSKFTWGCGRVRVRPAQPLCVSGMLKSLEVFCVSEQILLEPQKIYSAVRGIGRPVWLIRARDEKQSRNTNIATRKFDIFKHQIRYCP